MFHLFCDYLAFSSAMLMTRVSGGGASNRNPPQDGGFNGGIRGWS